MAEVFQVEILHQGETITISVPKDKTILEAALESGLELPYSCNAGVCTTCAAKVLSGTVDQSDAAGLGPDIRDKGYTLLCSAYPESDIKLESSQEDVVYQLQFGQFQN
ncbi:MAG: 2Fe-2S iron-sulfur cluster-binding protein [Leptolyngbyaceae bacterium]|nr:2Fe-2S iron-sulfur cluster-binding protein [Leptolyngbyaceae bacterium]